MEELQEFSACTGKTEHISIKNASCGQSLHLILCPYLDKKASCGQPLHPILCPYLNKKASCGQPLHLIPCPYLDKKVSCGQNSTPKTWGSRPDWLKIFRCVRSNVPISASRHSYDPTSRYLRGQKKGYSWQNNRL